MNDLDKDIFECEITIRTLKDWIIELDKVVSLWEERMKEIKQKGEYVEAEE